MKKLITSWTILMGLFMFIAMMAWASMATANMFGNGLSGDMGMAKTYESILVEGYEAYVGGGSSPREIYYDPTKGPWEKTFYGFELLDNQLIIHEVVHISAGGPGVSWTDWDEQIISDGWNWVFNPAPQLVLTNSAGQNLGTVIGDISSPDHQTVVFNFPAAEPPCTTLTITKTLQWVGEGEAPGVVVIDQWPTIPEPGTLVLLLSGAVFLAVFFRRRR